ncbi:MAG TPA: 1,6-anhydro-N-acetylmuramyl-L-alanine amidase AmpD [Casimicrobiaceae bacterium]|nr:1,6-anhydro-N-acetylmuramyl-L-alanine amidase AmpD [Casimicrobiaceae bacterium]
MKHAVRDARRRGHSLRTCAIDAQGYATHAHRVPSPNCDARPAACAIELVVVHGISLPPGHFAPEHVEALFTNRLDASADPYFASVADLRVSAHFYIQRDGALTQFVACRLRAWHAGQSSWRGRERCNDFSVGIELAGTDTLAYRAQQYFTLARLVHALQRRYPVRDIVGHSDIAPDRKTDPGPAFDWPYLRHLIARLSR